MTDNPMTLSIEPDLNQLAEWKKAYQGFVKPKEFNQALANAVNHALAHGKTKFKQEIVKKYTLTSSNAHKMMKVRKATTNNPTAEIKFNGARLAIARFYKAMPKNPPSQLRLPPSSRKRPTVELIRGQKHTSGSAFIARMKSGHVGVFQRGEEQALNRVGKLTKHTQRIEERTGSSIVTVANKKEVREPAWSSVSVDLYRRIDHEMRRLAERASP